MYYNNRDREMGDYFNCERVGKQVILKKNGDIYVDNY